MINNGSGITFLKFKPILAAWLLAGFLASCTVSQLTDINLANYKNYTAPNFGDADPYNIRGRKPNSYPIHGVDVSWHNKNINWDDAAKADLKFAFIKATEGKDNVDPMFKTHWSELKNSKMARSAYHFYYFCASPEDQAANYIRNVPLSDGSLPPILDVEWNPESPTCKDRPEKKVVVELLGRFLKEIQIHYKQKPIIYTTVDFHQDNLSDGSLKNYTYWLRSVTAQPRFKYGGRPWLFWQYTGTGLAPGFDGPVDINVFNGDEATWSEWVTNNSR